MKGRRLDALASPGFLACLLLLLLNDFALKPLFHNWATGKLSDFAGLFIFPLFWSALLPTRFRRAVYVLTALAFLFWKSPYSQLLIDVWNTHALLPLGRTVDASDLLALSMLPPSFLYGARRRRERAPRLAPHVLAGVSLFAFTATSYSTEIPYDNRYHFQGSPLELTRKVYHLEHLDPRYRAHCPRVLTTPKDLELRIPADFCFNSVMATVGVVEEQGQSALLLKQMQHDCPEGDDDKRKMLAIFEREYVEPLRRVQLVPPAGNVEASPSPSPAAPPPRVRGQLYLVPVGEVPGVSVEELAAHFRRKYDAPVRVLPKLTITNEMRQPNTPHGSPAAGAMIAAIAAEHPKLTRNTESIFVFITEEMTIEQEGNRRFNFFLDLEGRFGFLAAAALRPTNYCEPADDALLGARLRKVLTRAIGTLYFRLPRSEDPRSVLYNSVGCVDELDFQGEDF